MRSFRSLLPLLFTTAAVLVSQAQTTVPTVTRVIPDQILAPGGQATTLNLADFFGIPGVTGQVVQFDTVLGRFNVELRPDAAPRNVANFLGYVQRGDYSNTFFHRSAALDQTGAISIVQGGGYTATSAGIQQVPPQASVPLEYNWANERGTLAAARTSDINSATSEWYINVRDNSTILGPSNGGGYTVFGRVLGAGMSVVDAIAALPRVNAGSPFNQLPVRGYSSGDVQTSNLVVVNSITPISVYPGGGGTSALSFSVQSSAPGVVAASLSGSGLTLTPAGTGNATITVRATDVSGTVAQYAFSVSVATTQPAITRQPTSHVIATGDAVVFTVSATAANSYQWRKDGNDLFGATGSTLVVHNVAAANAGSYTVVARNPNGTAVSEAATLTVRDVAAPDAGRLGNLGVRSDAGSGDRTLIVGFSVGGSGTSGTAPLLLRAAGPSLAKFAVTDFLPDPVATMYSGNVVIASNDNWSGDGLVASRSSQVGAFEFLSSSSADAALAVSPAIGGYTMQVSEAQGRAGTALAEIYDATTDAAFTRSTPRLINLSARTQVGTGEKILIGSFVVKGSTSKTVLIRATGPALADFGVGGTLADPKLQLMRIGVSTPLAENDNWGGDVAVAEASESVAAFPILNGASRDAAILTTVAPGNYTAQVSGVNDGTGVALVEVYEVQ